MAISISDFVPTLQPMAEHVSVSLRYVCFFTLTSSVILKTIKAGNNVPAMLKPIATAALICGLIATLPFWFNLIRDTFWEIAVSIRQEFVGSPASTGAELMKSLKPPEDGINWLDLSDSLWKAVQFALGWLIVFVGGIVQLPMLVIQFIMECLCYLFLPIALSLFAIDATRGLALRYIQQTLAILAWPIGFAVVDLVGYSLLMGPVSAGSAVALGIGVATKFTPATMVIGCIVAIWLLLGSLATPVVMQMLFCSGSPMSSAMGQALQLGLGAIGLSKLGGGSGKAPPTPTAAAATPAAPMAVPFIAAGSILSALPALMGAMQRAALPPFSGPSPAVLPPSPPPKPSSGGAGSPMPPAGHTQPAKPPVTLDMTSDPSGTLYAANIMEQNRIPKSIGY